jgi:uncharacterized membrane protein (UPF0182 family)
LRRTRLVLYAALAAILLIVYSSGTIAWLFTEWQWFGAVGYAEVFSTLLTAQAVPALAVGALAGLAVYASGTIALTRVPAEPDPVVTLLRGTEPERAGVPDHLLRRGLLAVSVVLGLLNGLWAATRWEHALLFLHGGDFGFTEPIYGHDASFYVFTLPLLDDMRGFAFALVVLTGLVAGAAYAARGAIRLDVREVDGRVVPNGIQVDPRVTSHLGVQLGLLLVVFSAGVFLSRYAVMFDQSGVISGATHSDVNGRIPLLTAQAIATLAAAGLIGAGVARRRQTLVFAGLGAAAVAWVAVRAYPDVLQRFSVLPNELNLEAPYIAHHVEATRYAFSLDHIEEQALTGDASLTLEDIDNNRGTTNNVRLWDHDVLLSTFSQVQEIRTYYDFASVDNDRYMIDGELRQTMLSPRELLATSLPEQARTWVNETMTYTHGYGMALGPVNEVTEQGLPELFVKDLPPQISYPEDLRIDQPAIYYGETMNTPVFVRTRNEEFDYPSGEQNQYTVYAGDGGLPLSSLVTRMFMALRLKSAMVLLTNDLTPESRVLLHRDVVERTSVLAPFLTMDHDPYMVIVDGRLIWILDAYTTTNRFPYSKRVAGVGNYMRNSVKITVDAYDGTVTFYAMDEADPVLAAWREALPTLLRPAAEMPDGIRAHLRYPQDYFREQTALFATYHMTNPQIFYNREDEWEVPAVERSRMQPYYTIMRLPGEPHEEFILMLPFVPRNKPNLAAWMVARSDGDAYGTLQAYKFPKDKMVYGPNMIVARINQDDTISEKLSLWNQQGSQVVLGTLLVIPIEESLIYVQPLYLRAESGSIPELKRVIVGYEDEIAMAGTLDLALAGLFGGDGLRKPAGKAQTHDDPASPPDASPGRPEPTGTATATAISAYRELQQAASDNDWTAFGAALDRLGEALQTLEDDDVGEAAPAEDAPAVPQP